MQLFNSNHSLGYGQIIKKLQEQAKNKARCRLLYKSTMVLRYAVNLYRNCDLCFCTNGHHDANTFCLCTRTENDKFKHKPNLVEFFHLRQFLFKLLQSPESTDVQLCSNDLDQDLVFAFLILHLVNKFLMKQNNTQ